MMQAGDASWLVWSRVGSFVMGEVGVYLHAELLGEKSLREKGLRGGRWGRGEGSGWQVPCWPQGTLKACPSRHYSIL